jgi:hypothetical protein
MEKAKRKQWSEMDMFHAMEDCGAGMAIRQAAVVRHLLFLGDYHVYMNFIC